MQEIYKLVNGGKALPDKLTENVTKEQVYKALLDDNVQTVAIHKRGAVFKSGRRTYRVEDDGSLSEKRGNEWLPKQER